MIRVFALATFLMITLGLGCSAPPEQLADMTAPLFVDNHAGGHGPFLCTLQGGGTIPDWGCADISYSVTGKCQRWCGDVETGSGHLGAIITPGFVDPSFYWDTVHFSPNYTSGIACYGYPMGSSYAPCAGQVPGPVYGGSGSDMGPASFEFGPESLVLGYYDPCPLTPGMTQIHMCGTDWTPYDGSGLPTAVISDGHATLNLPRGNPLKLQPAHGTNVSCVAETANYPLPPGQPWRMMAVYSCP